jgi:hypothetical protein
LNGKKLQRDKCQAKASSNPLVRRVLLVLIPAYVRVWACLELNFWYSVGLMYTCSLQCNELFVPPPLSIRPPARKCSMLRYVATAAGLYVTETTTCSEIRFGEGVDEHMHLIYLGKKIICNPTVN